VRCLGTHESIFIADDEPNIRDVVTQHNGTIDAHSTDGGTIFTITF
jgi:hypothetical protein